MSTDSRFEGPGPDAQWSEALKGGRLCIQHCKVCDNTQFPPALVCRSCGAPSPRLVESDGHGCVYSATTVRSRRGDYSVAIIELREGPRIMSRIDGIPPEKVRIGLSVVAVIFTEADLPLLVFMPESNTP